jgi:hypothetical protein
MSKLNIVPADHNTSVYFVLPLLSLNKFSFGENNFCNSFLSFNGKIMPVVFEKEKAGRYWEHPYYRTDFDIELDENIKGTVIVYDPPSQFSDDISKFLDGQYSRFSLEAKEMIYKHSGLPYRVANPAEPGRVTTHKLLLVLERNEYLRKWLETELSIKVGADQELLERPHTKREFMDIDTILI